MLIFLVTPFPHSMKKGVAMYIYPTPQLSIRQMDSDCIVNAPHPHLYCKRSYVPPPFNHGWEMLIPKQESLLCSPIIVLVYVVHCALSTRRELKAISRITKTGGRGGGGRDREETTLHRDSPEDIQPIRLAQL
jgi:hypothetical protein